MNFLREYKVRLVAHNGAHRSSNKTYAWNRALVTIKWNFSVKMDPFRARQRSEFGRFFSLSLLCGIFQRSSQNTLKMLPGTSSSRKVTRASSFLLGTGTVFSLILPHLLPTTRSHQVFRLVYGYKTCYYFFYFLLFCMWVHETNE